MLLQANPYAPYQAPYPGTDFGAGLGQLIFAALAAGVVLLLVLILTIVLIVWAVRRRRRTARAAALARHDGGLAEAPSATPFREGPPVAPTQAAAPRRKRATVLRR